MIESYNMNLDTDMERHICDGDSLDDVLSHYDYIDFEDSYNGLTYVQRVKNLFDGVNKQLAYCFRVGVCHG